MRTFAILNVNDQTSDLKHCLTLARSLHPEQNIVICTTSKKAQAITSIDDSNIQIIPLFDDVDSEPVKRNKVLKHFKQNSNGFLHMLADNVKINGNISLYLTDVENMMTVFNYNIKLCNATDGCNYVYNKFNPRVSLDMDDIEFMQFGVTNLTFTSHANSAWIIYNLDKIDVEKSLFDERFTIPMFWIIKYLYDRTQEKDDKSIRYMNMYPTVSSEIGLIANNDEVESVREDQSKMETENELFRSLNLDISPLNSIDKVLEDVYSILKEKKNEH